MLTIYDTSFEWGKDQVLKIGISANFCFKSDIYQKKNFSFEKQIDMREMLIVLRINITDPVKIK